ncbi:ribonuclease H-like domain-containing protein [Tanacetum coccineum]
MRMEQYIQMVDYSLWEVIENGNAPPITKLVKGVETIIAPSTAEEKAQRRLELKARRTLSWHPNEHQLKLTTANDAKSLLQGVEKGIDKPLIGFKSYQLVGDSWDKVLKQEEIYEPELKGTSSLSINTKNVAFMPSNSTSNINGAVNTVHDVTTTSTQAIAINSTTFDNLSDAVIFQVECYYCPKKRTLFKECRAPRNQERQEYREHKMVPVDDNYFNGFDLSDGLVSDSEEEDVPQAKKEKKIVKSSFAKIKFVKSKEQVKSPRKTTVKQGLVSLTTARPVNTAQPKTTVNSARPMSNLFNKSHLTVRRPVNNKTTTKNNNFNKRVNIFSGKNVNNARPKAVVNAARPKAVLNVVKGNQDQGVIDSGCSRHMIRNMSYLTDFEEIDEGYVAFGGNPKGGKITGRDDYSRFSWVFFLATKDETSGILKSFITGVENLIDQRVKVIRCDNGTEFKNKEMNQFCERKGIKREFSVARTPQQNGVAERKNRTLIEAARTMLADSKLPTTFWAEAVNTACYVQNRVLVTKPHNKTPYELFLGRKPALGFMRPFGCPVTILNTIDHLGKFDGKADEGFFVGYSINSKAFRVFNSRTRIVEENLHVQFSENTPNIVGSGPNWLFDIDALTKSMNYKPVVAGNQSNGNAGTKACDDAGKARMETVPGKYYILLPLWTADPPFSQSSKSSPDDGFKPSGDDEKKVTKEPGKEGGDSSKDSECSDQEKEDNVNNTNNVNAASTNEVNVIGTKTSIKLPNDSNMPELEDIFYSDDDEDVGAEADMNNLDAFMPVSPIPTTRVHKDHPVEQIIGDLNSAPQTRRMTKNLKEHGLFSSVHQRTNHKDFQNCLFACFLSQEEPKKVIHALQDLSWIEAMQDELL